MAQATRDVVGDVLGQLSGLSPGQLRRLMRDLSGRHRRELIERWQGWAQEGQCEPPGDWRIWMIRAGRGFGKTRAGAEWISEWARMLPGARIALVAANDADGRRVMIEGPSGLLAVARSDEGPLWRESLRELHFDSGAVATLYSAAAAENLRGPEHHVAWCDELAKWPGGDAAWDNLVMGLRLGVSPRILVTTTPKPTSLMRRIIALPGFEETRGGTNDNAYASVFDRVDRGGDVVRAGAFAASLRERSAVPLLWQHRPGASIGVIEALAEDARGLRVVAWVTHPAAAKLVAAGALTGLSFGYRVQASRGDNPRELVALDLAEVSLVAAPMQPLARVIQVVKE